MFFDFKNMKYLMFRFLEGWEFVLGVILLVIFFFFWWFGFIFLNGLFIFIIILFRFLSSISIRSMFSLIFMVMCNMFFNSIMMIIFLFKLFKNLVIVVFFFSIYFNYSYFYFFVVIFYIF